MEPHRRPATDRGGRRVLGTRAQWLVEQAHVTDRGSRFERHLRHIRDRQKRRERRRRVRLRVSMAAFVGGAVIVGAVVGRLGGAVVGLLVATAVAAAWWGAEALAAKRGASAWDWRAQRYRLLGDPSRVVQDLDDPEA